uniref:PhiE125 gp8 family protein n=1 Tax=Rhodopseudomonas palustris (strain BisA53) TaxID=316055 RepID=Q07QC6_RHOP5
MSAMRLQGPTVEPWTVEEAKSFLRVTHDADDAVIGALIAAARAQIEALTRRALLVQRWRLTLDRWPADRCIAWRIGPLRTLLAARVYDMAGVAQPVDPAGFVLDTSSDRLIAPLAPPVPGRCHAGIELDAELGFGSAPSEVPEPLRHAVRTLAAHWYDHRGLIASGGGAMLPANVAAMIASYRGLAL